MFAHKQLHVKRGGLYNCDQCVFNVTKLHILYDHYRYSHMVEEPELKYPEESVIRAGHKELLVKNSGLDVSVDKMNSTDIPMLWSFKDGAFNKVFKCRYCPHTNQRRHNTLEHEKMHSDHPDHAAPPADGPQPQHPCKRCTYVCNNGGVLSSHLKVHARDYSSVVGFCDTSIRDAMQMKALEYVLELESELDVHDQDDNGENERPRSADDSAVSSGRADEKEDPVLKFCQYCPARFFFVKDLACHVRFHRYRWPYTCDCCSFKARDKSFVDVHEVVHRDEYENRTTELMRSYSVSDEYPKPAEYTGDSPPPPVPPMRLSRPKKLSVTRPPPSPPSSPLPSKRRRSSDTVTTEPPIVADDKSAKKKLPPTKAVPKGYVKQFTCNKCPGRFFKTTALQYHLTLHGGPGPHKCRRCDYAVSTYGNLIRHETVHEDLAPREKTRSRSMRNPNAVTSNATVAMLPTTRPPNSPPQSSDATAAAYADAAGRSPTPGKRDDGHMDPEFGKLMYGNPEFYYPTTVKNGVAKEKRYKCPKCPSAFDKRDQYKVHLTLHGADDKYKCDKCDYSVKYTANYVQHQRKHALHVEMKNAAVKAIQQMQTQNEERNRVEDSAADEPPAHVDPVISRSVFTNEISDKQTAYELDSAYKHVHRCKDCPFECSVEAELEKHAVHHSSKRWKRVCNFCTYVTQTESDLSDHMRVHFMKQPSTVAAAQEDNDSGDHASTDVDPDESTESHIEYHGKRVYQSGDEKDEEPFFVFKDIGPGFAGKIRFSPKCEPLIDYNDNSTKPAFIKFVNDGKRIEFVDKKKKKK